MAYLAIFALLFSGGTNRILQISLMAVFKSLETSLQRMCLVGHAVLFSVSLCHNAK